VDLQSFDQSLRAGYIAAPQESHSKLRTIQERYMAGNEQMIIDLDKQRMTAMRRRTSQPSRT
jgi:hypothetical protein